MRCENESNWRPFLLHAINYLKGLKLQNGQFVSESVRKTGVIGFVKRLDPVTVYFAHCPRFRSSEPYNTTDCTREVYILSLVERPSLIT